MTGFVWGTNMIIRCLFEFVADAYMNFDSENDYIVDITLPKV